MKALNTIKFPKLTQLSRSPSERMSDDKNQDRLNQNFKVLMDEANEIREIVEKISGGSSGGEPGPQGPPGAVFTPTVSTDGIISWKNNGGLTNPESVNIMGPQGNAGLQGPQGEQGLQGPQGEKGEQGVSAGFGTPVATVVTVASNEQAEVTVTASGDDTAKVFTFEFSIPQGEQGEQGEQGIQGVQGPQGETGPNEINPETATPFYGLLKGMNGNVSTAEPGIDYAIAPTNNTVQLPVTGWVNNEQTALVVGVTELNNIIVTPAPESVLTYNSCGVWANLQSADSITFKCRTQPTTDLLINILILS